MSYYISANTAKDYYALERLCIFMGVFPQKTVRLLIGNENDLVYTDAKDTAVFFYHADDRFPDVKTETTIKNNKLFLNTNIINLIHRSLGQPNHDQNVNVCEAFSNSTSNHTYQKLPIAFLDQCCQEIKLTLIDFFNSQGIAWEQFKPWDRPVICLTHDVDSIKGKSFFRYAYWIARAAGNLNPQKIRDVLGKINDFISQNYDPHFSFLQFADMEEKNGFKSTFFLMSLLFSLGSEGRRYSIYNRKLRLVCKELIRRGWEIGLHPSRKSHKSERALKWEKNRLLSSLDMPDTNLGVRNHYLKTYFPDTWLIQEQIGIRYDSSVGFRDRPGFAAGTCRPYQPFDLTTNRLIDIWELPLCLMDGTITGNSNEIVNACIKIAEECFKHEGVFVLLWHTNRFHHSEYPQHSKAYPRILEYFSSRGCIGLTGGEIINQYKQYSENMRRFIKTDERNYKSLSLT